MVRGASDFVEITFQDHKWPSLLESRPEKMNFLIFKAPAPAQAQGRTTSKPTSCSNFLKRSIKLNNHGNS
jgi:hypothetical protein